MPRDFGSKTGNFQGFSELKIFEVKSKQKPLKDGKFTALQNGYLQFSEFWNFDPEFQNFAFQRYMPTKSKTLKT